MTLTNYSPVKLIKNLSEHKTLFLWLALLWTAIVTFFCLINFNDLPKVAITHYDKLGHITFHFGITFSWFLYFRFQKSYTSNKSLLTAFLVSLFYGITIEICQGVFTDSRQADIFDVFANMTGASLAVITLLFIIRFNRQNENK